MNEVITQCTEPLDKTTILASLDPVIRNNLNGLIIEASLDSTNSAMKRLPLAEQHATVILAEHQSTGRGRRGREWHSPFGRNLYFSLGWKFNKPLSELGCLPLVVALATADALSRVGLQGHRVKWPNDLLLDSRKLCGCLVDTQGEPQGACHAVIGVGINVNMPVSEQTASIDQPWIDLHSQLPDCSRNELTAVLLEELITQLELFAGKGFAPFRDKWREWDGLYGQTINAYTRGGSVQGIANGIDEHGALLLNTGDGILKLHSGEVSLRETKL
jgi:BirA family biotin operon repressor/biotin-[acetyl-CoA-carboxylase] ligase